jgi:hypothetical protein
LDPEASRVPFAGPGACEAPAEHDVGGGRHLARRSLIQGEVSLGRVTTKPGGPFPAEDGSTTTGVGAPKGRGSFGSREPEG